MPAEISQFRLQKVEEGYMAVFEKASIGRTVVIWPKNSDDLNTPIIHLLSQPFLHSALSKYTSPTIMSRLRPVVRRIKKRKVIWCPAETELTVVVKRALAFSFVLVLWRGRRHTGQSRCGWLDNPASPELCFSLAAEDVRGKKINQASRELSRIP